MAKKIVIIGAGPGGYVAALRASQLGGEVVLIEQSGVGGTCLHRGCIPSKVMKRSAEILEGFKRGREFGVEWTGEFRPAMHLIQQRKAKVIQDQVDGIKGLLKRARVSLVKGAARTEAPGRVSITMEDGTRVQHSYDRLILATGSQPAGIPCCPFDGRGIISSKEALSLEEVPRALLIVGGGVIGCEFASIFSCLGSKVTIVEALDRLLPLPSVDEECSRVIQREMKKRKIPFLLNRSVEAVEREGERMRVFIGPPRLGEGTARKEAPMTLEVDKVLLCVGRRPNTGAVGLEKIGVTTDEKGWIIADERMQTAGAESYAIGDALGPSRVMLAHVASREGEVAAENAMGHARVMDYHAVPGAIFTMPEVANVGLTEIQAKEEGFHLRSDRVLFRNLGKSQVIGEIAGMVKIVSEVGTGTILGVHMVGAHATDIIAEATLALHMGCRVQDLAETIHAHPTLAEGMFETSLSALDRPLHG